MKKICMMLLFLCLIIPLQGCGSGNKNEGVKAKDENERKEFMQLIVDGTLKLYTLDNYQLKSSSTYKNPTCDGDKVKLEDIEQTQEGKYSVKDNKYRSVMETTNKTMNTKEKMIINFVNNKQYFTYEQNGKKEPGGATPSDYFQAQKDYINSFVKENLANIKEVYKIEEDGNTTIRLVYDEKKLSKMYGSSDALKVNDGACMLSKREVKSLQEDYTINNDGIIIHYESSMVNVYDDEEFETKGIMDYSGFNTTEDIKLDVSEEEIDPEDHVDKSNYVDVPVYSLERFQKVGDVLPNHGGWTVEFNIVMTQELTEQNYFGRVESGDGNDMAIKVITKQKEYNSLCSVETGTNKPIILYPDHDICDHPQYHVYQVYISLENPHVITEKEVRNCINSVSLTTKQLKSIKGVYQTTKTYSDVSSLLN